MSDVVDNPPSGTSRITFRAIVIGLLGGTALAAGGYLNDALGLTPVVGNTLPVSIYGPLVVVGLLLAPLLQAIHPILRLRAGELAVIVAIMLASAGIATNGMMKFFIPMIGMPAKYYSGNEGWKNADLMQYVPKGLILADGNIDDPAAGIFAGGPPPGRTITPADMQWILEAWRGPLSNWLPIMGMVVLAGLSLAMLVQRQWSQRERLAFPIVEFANTVIHGKTSAGRSILGSPGFWWAMSAVLCIHLVNGLHAMKPNWIGAISLNIPLAVPLVQKFPTLGQVWDTYCTFNPTLFFTVVGFSFFVARDVSFTLGIAAPLNTIGIAVLMSLGINLYGGPGAANYMDFLRLGGTVGLAIAIVHHGRAYYRVAFARALCIPVRGATSEGVWAARVLLASSTLLIVLLVLIGMAWPVALLEVLMLLLTFLILMRIGAETGLFYVQSGFVLADNVHAAFGLVAMGPKQTFLATFFGTMGVGDSRVIMGSMALHGLELCDRQKVPTRRVWPWMWLMVALGIGAAIPTILYSTYSHGIGQIDVWANVDAPQWPFHETMTTGLTPLQNAGLLAKSSGLSDWQRLVEMSPMNWMRWELLIGIGLVFMLSALRMRFPRWPIHPILIPVLGIVQVALLSFSFLVGWFLRTAVNRFGGGAATQRAKPIMVGLIAGDLVGAIVWMAVGQIYYAVTGLPPKPFSVFP